MLLPESLVVGAAFYRKSTGALIGPTALTVYRLGTTTADPDISFSGGFALRLGMHGDFDVLIEDFLRISNAFSALPPHRSAASHALLGARAFRALI